MHNESSPKRWGRNGRPLSEPHRNRLRFENGWWGSLGFSQCPADVVGKRSSRIQPCSSWSARPTLQLQSFKALLKEKGKGTARDNINLGTFENQTFPFPTLEVQKKIVSTLNRLNSETQRLESIYQQKLDALDELKKSLLHQAFVGKL
jgi:type I restriction enzyme S subunit